MYRAVILSGVPRPRFSRRPLVGAGRREGSAFAVIFVVAFAVAFAIAFVAATFQVGALFLLLSAGSSF